MSTLPRAVDWTLPVCSVKGQPAGLERSKAIGSPLWLRLRCQAGPN